MALSEDKARRTREVAALLCEVSRRQGLEPTLFLVGRRPERVLGHGTHAALHALEFDGQEDLLGAMKRAPRLRRAGLRIVISDFLFEAPLDRFAETVSRESTATHLVQLLDAEDVDPSGARIRTVGAPRGFCGRKKRGTSAWKPPPSHPG